MTVFEYDYTSIDYTHIKGENQSVLGFHGNADATYDCPVRILVWFCVAGRVGGYQRGIEKIGGFPSETQWKVPRCFWRAFPILNRALGEEWSPWFVALWSAWLVTLSSSGLACGGALVVA